MAKALIVISVVTLVAVFGISFVIGEGETTSTSAPSNREYDIYYQNCTRKWGGKKFPNGDGDQCQCRDNIFSPRKDYNTRCWRQQATQSTTARTTTTTTTTTQAPTTTDEPGTVYYIRDRRCHGKDSNTTVDVKNSRGGNDQCRCIKRGLFDFRDNAKCTRTATTTVAPTTTMAPTTTQEPSTTSAEVTSTEAPETEAPSTEAPETEAPSTEAPETEAPSTEAPETEAPETEAPETTTE